MIGTVRRAAIIPEVTSRTAPAAKAPVLLREAPLAEGENGVQGEPELGEGIIEISGKGFGFLRDPKRNFVQTPQDIFVTPEIVRRFGLRDGMWVNGETRRGNRGPQLTKLTPSMRRSRQSIPTCARSKS